MIYLARELVDLILGNLDDDKMALSACTLLSRHWYISARPALFHHITFTSRGRLDNEHMICKFYVLAVPLNVARLVKKLTLDLGPYWSQKNHKYTYFHPTLSPYQLNPILAKFPAVHSLTLRNVELEYWSEMPKQTSPPRSLSKLYLRNVYVQTLKRTPNLPGDVSYSKYEPSKCSMVQLLNMFGAIELLFLRDVRPSFTVVPLIDLPEMAYCAAAGSEIQRLLSNLSVRQLCSRSHSVFFHTILDLLMCSPALDALKFLQLNDSIAVSRRILSAVGRSLRYLRIGINDPLPGLLQEGTRGLENVSVSYDTSILF